MKKLNKLLILLFLISTLIFQISCSNINKYNEVFNSYIEKWILGDYAGMYSLLTSDSKNYIDEDTFINRYNTVYSALKFNNLEITLNNDLIKNDGYYTASFTLSGNCIAGDFSFNNFNLDIYKENDKYLIKWNESLILPEMIKGDKVYVKTSNHIRGKILDRNGKILAEDGQLSVVGIHPSKFNTENRNEKITELANILDISEETITSKLDANTNPEFFVPIVNMTSTDEKLQLLSNKSEDGIIINNKTSRVYYGGEAFGRLIGYVGNITAEELENKSNDGYTSTSLIGKAGIEQVFEDTLRGEDGAEIYIKRGSDEISILKKEVINGEDIKLTIDSTYKIIPIHS